MQIPNRIMTQCNAACGSPPKIIMASDMLSKTVLLDTDLAGGHRVVPIASGNHAALTKKGKLLWRKKTAPESEYVIAANEAARREVPYQRETIQADNAAMQRWIQMYHAIVVSDANGSW